MTINGVEIGLAYTVRASIELGKINGGHSMKEFFDSLDTENDEKDYETITAALKILHNAYDRQRSAEEAKEGRIYTPTEIDEDALYDMKMSEWQKVIEEIISVIQKDSGVEVEAEPDKKAKKRKRPNRVMDPVLWAPDEHGQAGDFGYPFRGNDGHDLLPVNL